MKQIDSEVYIVVKLDDKEFKLTVDDALKLYEKLNNIFSENTKNIVYPNYPVQSYYEDEWTPDYPLYPTITCESKNEN